MRKPIFISLCVVAGLLSMASGAQACQGKFSLEFGYTTKENWTMKSGTSCRINYNFDYVALYGVSVREQAKNGVVRVTGKNSLEYVPRNGFRGTDTFIIEVEGGYVNWQSGNATMRSKAGAAVTMQVN